VLKTATAYIKHRDHGETERIVGRLGPNLITRAQPNYDFLNLLRIVGSFAIPHVNGFSTTTAKQVDYAAREIDYSISNHGRWDSQGKQAGVPFGSIGSLPR